MKSRLPRKAAITEMERAPSIDPFGVNSRGLPSKVFVLRQKLCRKAKAEPKFRFYALYDRIYRPDVLAGAWALVARNKGGPGVDGVGISDVESRPDGVQGFLDELREELRTKAYCPQAVRLISHFSRRSHHGLRPPEGWSWYRLLTEQLGYQPVSGNLPRGDR